MLRSRFSGLLGLCGVWLMLAGCPRGGVSEDAGVPVADAGVVAEDSGTTPDPDAGSEEDAGTDAGFTCQRDDDCAQLPTPGLRCDYPTGTCVPADPCSLAANCTRESPREKDHYCSTLTGGPGCRCVPTDGLPDGRKGVCRRRLSACEPCTSNEQCGAGTPLEPAGACMALDGDTTGAKYCVRKPVGACPTGFSKALDGYCKPATGSCEQPGCATDKDCPGGRVCDAQRGLCEYRCSWDFANQQLRLPGCKTGETCWVDEQNLDPSSPYFGAGRCRAPCKDDAQCQTSTFGGPDFVCKAEKIKGGVSEKRCRPRGECMDRLECEGQPTDAHALGYCDLATFECKPNCRVGTDPQTAKPYRDCEAHAYKCEADPVTNEGVCKQQSCLALGGAATACYAGELCCGEDRNADGKPDESSCPPNTHSDGCYAPSSPPACTTCTSDADCAGLENYSGSPLPNVCQPTPSGISLCALSTWNDITDRKDVKGCPSGRLIIEKRIVCSADADCQVGGNAAGKCTPDPDVTYPDGSPVHFCSCSEGGKQDGCPQAPDAPSWCSAQTASWCITTRVCDPGDPVAAQGRPVNGCGF